MEGLHARLPVPTSSRRGFVSPLKPPSLSEVNRSASMGLKEQGQGATECKQLKREKNAVPEISATVCGTPKHRFRKGEGNRKGWALLKQRWRGRGVSCSFVTEHFQPKTVRATVTSELRHAVQLSCCSALAFEP